jgi:hypothetical protein
MTSTTRVGDHAKERVMAKVLGLGGFFFKASDPSATREWYDRVLGIPAEQWGAIFTSDAAAANPGAGTVFSPFA